MLKWNYLIIGSIAGGFSRYFLAGAVSRRIGAGFPHGTLAVNLSACLLIGFFNSLAEEKFLLGPNERILLMTGFCGAYSTFSTLILETSNLLKDGELFLASSNVVVSLVAGLLLFRLGEYLGKAV